MNPTQQHPMFNYSNSTALVTLVALATPFFSTLVHAQTVPAPPPPGTASVQLQQPPTPKKRRFPPLGVDLEFARFLDSKTRNRFGAGVFSIGPGLGSVAPTIEGKIGPDISITNASRTIGGFKNKLFVVSVGPEYKRVYIPPAVLRKIREAQAAGARAQAEAIAAAQANGQTGPPPSPTAPGGGQGGAFPGGPPPGFPTGPPAGFGPPSILPYYGASLSALYAKVKVPGENIDGSGFGVGGSVFVGVSFKERAFLEARLRGTTSVRSANFSRAGLTFGVRF